MDTFENAWLVCVQHYQKHLKSGHCGTNGEMLKAKSASERVIEQVKWKNRNIRRKTVRTMSVQSYGVRGWRLQVVEPIHHLGIFPANGFQTR